MLGVSKPVLIVSFFLTLSLCLITSVSADYGQWNSSGVCVDTLCAGPFWFGFSIVPDGYGGVVVTWALAADDGYDEIRAQRIRSNGELAWGVTGIEVDRDDMDDYPNQGERPLGGPTIISGNQNRYIVSWIDDRAGARILAQNYDTSGTMQWNTTSTSGIMLLDDDVGTSTDLRSYDLVADGLGGAIAACPGHAEIWLQRINCAGDTLWSYGGISYGGISPYHSDYVSVETDSKQSAIFAWVDDRDGDTDIYIQKADSNSTICWDATGLLICDASQNQESPKLVKDGADGIFCAWFDKRFYGDVLYAQRITANGNVEWSENGIAVSTAIGRKLDHSLVCDGVGGFVITWRDNRDDNQHQDNDYNIYAQRIDNAGILQWESLGEVVCSAYDDQTNPVICSDGDDGYIIAWIDGRDGDKHIYAQRIDETGNSKWKTDGIPINTNVCDAIATNIAADGNTGACIMWCDHPSTAEYSFFAQIIDSYFDFPTPAADNIFWESSATTPLCASSVFGCPEGDASSIRITVDFNEDDVPRDIEAEELVLVKPDTGITFWNASGDIYADSLARYGTTIKTTFTHAYLSHNYDTGTKTIVDQDIDIKLNDSTLGQAAAVFVRSPDYTADGKVNSSDLTHFGSTYNKLDTSPAYNAWFDFNCSGLVNLTDFSYMGEHYNDEYPGLSSPLRLLSGNNNFIAGRIETQYVKSENTILVPVYLTGLADVTTAVLFFEYHMDNLVYEGFMPDNEVDLTSACLPVTRKDGRKIFISLMKINTASVSEKKVGTIVFSCSSVKDEDVSDLVSFDFGECSSTDGVVKKISIASSEIVKKAVTTTDLGNAFPNPFNPTTAIQYSLDKAGPVNMSIYNVNGALIKTLVNETQKSGFYSAEWKGRDNTGRSVTTGVYFVKLTTTGYFRTKKLILLR